MGDSGIVFMCKQSSLHLVFLEQKWLWPKLPIKLSLAVSHSSSGLNHTMQVIAQHCPLEPMLFPG